MCEFGYASLLVCSAKSMLTYITHGCNWNTSFEYADLYVQQKVCWHLSMLTCMYALDLKYADLHHMWEWMPFSLYCESNSACMNDISWHTWMRQSKYIPGWCKSAKVIRYRTHMVRGWSKSAYFNYTHGWCMSTYFRISTTEGLLVM